MSNDRITIQLDGEAELLRRLDRLIQQVAAPDALMASLAAILESRIHQRLDTETAPGGTPWLPLADATKAIDEKQYDGAIPGSLLERTRQMRSSLCANSSSDWPEEGMSRMSADTRSGPRGWQRAANRPLNASIPLPNAATETSPISLRRRGRGADLRLGLDRGFSLRKSGRSPTNRHKYFLRFKMSKIQNLFVY